MEEKDLIRDFEEMIRDGDSPTDSLLYILEHYRDHVIEDTLLLVRRELLSTRPDTLDRDAVADWLARSAVDADVRPWWG